MGNIQTADEGKACIDFAVDCYSWAYEQHVLLGRDYDRPDYNALIVNKAVDLLYPNKIVINQ